VDLVEIAPNANPPVCRIVDFGKYRYEQSKKDKESRKHQHGNKVKEIQLSPTIDPHDFSVKLSHAVEFLCEDMKVKVTLRFRGRENIHKEFGFQQVQKFIEDIAAYGHPDAPPKLIGRGINVMISPLPRNKRAKPPHDSEKIPRVPNSATGAILSVPITILSPVQSYRRTPRRNPAISVTTLSPIWISRLVKLTERRISLLRGVDCAVIETRFAVAFGL